jgi:hypothetical protein
MASRISVQKRTDQWPFLEHVGTWPTGDDLLGDDIRARYRSLRSAIILFSEGAKFSEIASPPYVVNEQNFYRMINRCAEFALLGKLPHKALLRHSEYIQSRDSTAAMYAAAPIRGALGALFRKCKIEGGRVSLESQMLKLVVDGVFPGSSRKDRRISWAVIR